MKALREYLPGSPDGRAAWAARLAYWGVVSSQPEPPPDHPVRGAVEEGRGLARESRALGHMREELDPATVVDEFVRRMFTSAIRMLMEPGPGAQEKELADLEAEITALMRERQPSGRA